MHDFTHIIFSGKHFKIHLLHILRYRNSVLVGAEFLCVNKQSFPDKKLQKNVDCLTLSGVIYS